MGELSQIEVFMWAENAYCIPQKQFALPEFNIIYEMWFLDYMHYRPLQIKIF